MHSEEIKKLLHLREIELPGLRRPLADCKMVILDRLLVAVDTADNILAGLGLLIGFYFDLLYTSPYISNLRYR